MENGALLTKMRSLKAQKEHLEKDKRVAKPPFFEDKGGSAMLPPSVSQGSATELSTYASATQTPLQPRPSQDTAQT